ncbi:MAG: CapA family protein [Anaerolineaceae bacterium]
MGDTDYQQSMRIYALVAPFPTVSDDVSAEALREFWQGQAAPELAFNTLTMSEDTLEVISDVWGKPSDGITKILSIGESLVTWPELTTWAIIPFEELTPRWKVINIDGISPLNPNESLNSYPLAITYYLSGKPGSEAIWGNYSSKLQLVGSNRDTAKMTSVVMTGVTALVRATASKMENNGITYPGQDIRAWLREADITHINNEISFINGCPPPNPVSTSLMFCSDPKYIGLLEDVGADVIELTGNHLNDWKADGTELTLDLYRERGWQYFGGGSDLADSRKPALFEHNGNRIAFIGCNAPGPVFDWATEERGGAASCDDYVWIINAIRALKAEGYQVVVTVQYYENYSYYAGELQQNAFRPLADAGAVVVQGSQAHTPKVMEFRQDAFIHYGLGNLFFDQMNVYDNGKRIDATRQEFIDRYTFYDNHLISIELLTAMLEDYSKPRPMTLEERQSLLQTVFSINDWK